MTLQLNPLFIPFIPAEVSSASSAVYHQGLFGQSAPSARSRSSEGSSDDQVPVPTHDGFIEVDLRAGGPQLCESPCQTLRPIPRTHEYYQALDGHNGYLLIGQLMNICNQEGLNYSAIDFCGRRSIYTPKRDPIVTLLIRANRPDVTQRGWADIARKLQYHLRGQGLPGISVEIMDPRLEEDAKIHSCHPNDAVVPMWTNIVYDILARVHDTTGINTIGCFRIGRDMDRLRCPPTVLVGIDRQVFRDWKVVREAIVSALNSRGLESVGVRIRKDKKPLRANNVERNPIQPSDCRPDPPLGYSLSPHNMKDAIGTLGGWVELKSPRTGQWVSFAITCTHCCLPPRGALNDEDQEVLCKWKQEGVRIGDPNAARLLSVDAPCYRDIKTGIDAKESVMDTVKTAEFYRGVEEARAQGRSSSSGDQEGWKRASDCLSELDEERNTIKSFVRNGQHVLGNMFAASGLREARSTDDPDKLSVRDWALVQPKSGRSAGDNAVQLARELPHIRHLGEFETALPQNDQGVYKIGRASGFTRGMYGNLKVCHLDTIMLENGQKVTRTAWEHAVTKSPGAFLELGDSGSLLFNVSGDVLGILFGASEKGDIAYFTATGDLLQDIRSITGALEVRMKQTQLQEELDEYISSNFGGTRKS